MGEHPFERSDSALSSVRTNIDQKRGFCTRASCGGGVFMYSNRSDHSPARGNQPIHQSECALRISPSTPTAGETHAKLLLTACRCQNSRDQPDQGEITEKDETTTTRTPLSTQCFAHPRASTTKRRGLLGYDHTPTLQLCFHYSRANDQPGSDAGAERRTY